MQIVSYTEARGNLKSLMKKADKDFEQIVITRKNGQPMVLISMEQFNSLSETEFLLSSPKNAARLRESIEEMNGEKGEEHPLVKL